MSSIISFISILNYLADFINFIFLLFLSFIIFIIINKNFEINLIKKNKITKLFYYEFFIFSLLLLTPFLVNNFLIDWWKFPDQAKYFNQTYDERTFSARDNFYLGVYYVSKIYAYFPIPFLETFIFLMISSFL